MLIPLDFNNTRFEFHQLCIIKIFFFILLIQEAEPSRRLMGWWVRIPPGIWMSVCCICCVLSGRGPCVGLIIRPEKSYRVCYVWA